MASRVTPDVKHDSFNTYTDSVQDLHFEPAPNGQIKVIMEGVCDVEGRRTTREMVVSREYFKAALALPTTD